MPSILKPTKTRLTKVGKTLDDLLRDSQQWISFNPPRLDSDDDTYDHLTGKKRTLHQRVVNMEAAKKSLEEALANFHDMFSKLEQSEQISEETAYENYTETAWDLITSAEAMLGKLMEKEVEIANTLENISRATERRIQAERSSDIHGISSRESGQSSPISPIPAQLQAPLPRLQLPKFSGRRQEWDSFWATFKTSIDDQPISQMMKFNYLLQALVGEAKQTAAQFEVIEGNYQVVVDFLRKKYGSDTLIIEELLAQLEQSRADGPSTKQQANLLERISALLMQLSTKGQDINHRLILNMVLRKFNSEVQAKALEKRENLEDIKDWTWTTLRHHLAIIIDTKERIERSQESIKKSAQPTQNTVTNKRSTAICIYCKRSNHRSIECRTVPLPDRAAFLTRNQLCHNCGKPNHRTEDCRSPGCFKCGRKHHSSLCFHNPQSQSRQSATQERTAQAQTQPIPRSRIQSTGTRRQSRNGALETARQTSQNVVTSEGEERLHSPQEDSEVYHVSGKKTQKTGALLLTGTTTIQGPKRAKQVRILMDTGSELSFIDSKLVDELELPIKGETTLRLKTFGSESANESQHRIVQVTLVDKEGKNHECELLDNPVIATKSNSVQLTLKDMKYINHHGLSLSSPPEDQSQPQILLGCDQLWEMMESKRCKLPSGIHLIDTKFGHMLSGTQTLNKPQQLYEVKQIHNEVDTWDKYWSMESSGIDEYTGPQKMEKLNIEQKVMKKFKETIVKKDDGYYVRLPWKEDHPRLPDNKRIAIARLRSLLKQYHNQPHVLQEFQNTFEDQLQKGIIEEVTPEMKRTTPRDNIIHYLAYQVVATPEKKTTPRRIVFDASAHYSGELSLNEVLHQGPLILPNLNGMLMRFRVGKIAIAADIEKAFLQVRLLKQDRDATRFLWIKDLSKPFDENNIVTYRFTRVTFGLNSSPFLLAATISFHLETTTYNPIVTKEIKDNLYVDNLLLTAETKEQACQQYREVKKIFNEINMNMREFISNDPEVMAQFDDKDKNTTAFCKVLGIGWNATEDKLIAKCDVKPMATITKRSILHIIASVYDPLGWLTPLMVRCKHFFQSLWTKPYQWDDILSQQDQETWKKLFNSIRGFRKEVPRQLANKHGSHQLVTFSDASTRTMAACVYIKNDEKHSLIQAKTKLPSLKTTHTIPKLEVNALTIAARLTLSTFEELRKSISIDAAYILTDSEIALSWLKNVGESKIAGVLVTNRVREIRRIYDQLQSDGVQVHFGYVNTKENPADCATRGLNSEQLENHSWWKGPQFLSKSGSNWPAETKLFQLQPQIAEVLEVSTTEDMLIDWTRFSSATKLKRTIAVVLKFLQKTSRNLPAESIRRISKAISIQEQDDDTNTITVSTLKNAWGWIIKLHQRETNSARTSHLQRKLNMHQDEKGLWRCYGRLGRSFLPEETKNPIFIAPNTKIAQLIITDTHGTLHRSTAHTMLEIRQKYWIPKLRQQVKKILRKCIQCQKSNNFPFRYPPLADLPHRRVTRSRPFQHVGLDLFGPLKTRNTEGIQTKAYGCIFTCATTRLLHLEVISDNTTVSFINAMRRFMSRRGVPDSITCDNAPSFLLAEKILTDNTEENRSEEHLSTFMANAGIKWMKITPYAPWQGGFYERLIKDVKTSLRKAMGRKIIDEDSLRTILVEIEGCLNSRPLTYQGEEMDEIALIRPIDFIQKHITISYPMINIRDDLEDPNFQSSEEALQLRTRKQTEQALRSSCDITEQFWRLWNSAYLTSLREHHRSHLDQGRSSSTKPKEGQLVLIHDPFLPRNAWKVARITRLLPAVNGEIRQVELQMANRKTTTRPVNLLVPLELNEEEEDGQNETTGQVQDRIPVARNNAMCNNTNLPHQNVTENRPKRNTTRNYPYSEKEYELNLIYQDYIQPNIPKEDGSTTLRYRMNPREATRNLFESMNWRMRSMFEEEEIQRRLDSIYDDITFLLRRASILTLNFECIQKLIAQQNPPPNARQTNEQLTKLFYDLQSVKLKMSNNLAVGELLWESYDMLIEANLTSKQSRRRYEERPRIAARPHDRITNRTIITKEQERLTELEQEVLKTKIDAFEEEPKEDLLTERMNCFEELLRDTNSSLQNILTRVRRTESMVYDKLVKPETTFQNSWDRLEAILREIQEKNDSNSQKMIEKMEELLSRNQTPHCSSKVPELCSRSPSPNEKENQMITSRKRKRRYEGDQQPPHRVAVAQSKLANLTSCPSRKFGTPLNTRVGNRICPFCDAVGTHTADACPVVTTVENRMRELRHKKLCKICLQRCHENPCSRDAAKCFYCRMSNHNTALCYLPEERAALQAIIDDWRMHCTAAGGECAQEAPMLIGRTHN